MQVSDLIFNVAILFIMMIPGVILKKCNLVDGSFGKGISNLVLYIAQPLLIVYAYVSCESKLSEIWVNVVMVFILSIVAHIIFAVVAMLLFKKTVESRAKMLRFATIFSNAAFMGIPLIESILGGEAAIYASIYNITFNLFLWTLGVHLCTRNSGEDMDGDGDSDLTDSLISAKKNISSEISLLKVALHPVTLASVIGVILLAFGVNITVLEAAGLGIISECLFMIKNLVAPLSMVVIGLRLAEISFKGIFKDKDMYIFLILRHALLPLAVVAVTRLLMLVNVPISETSLLVVTILASAPAASSATMFAEKYDCDAGYVSKLVTVSTILSIVTMPLVVMVATL